jgi:hypothetical protein
MSVQQQSAQIEQFFGWQPDRRKTIFCQQLQNQLRVAPIMFLLPWFRRSNRRGMADLAFDSQLLHQVQKPMHRSGGFDTYKHRARKLGIKLPYVAIVHQRQIHHFSRFGVQHRQRLLASVQITSYNSHSASFVPSASG